MNVNQLEIGKKYRYKEAYSDTIYTKNEKGKLLAHNRTGSVLSIIGYNKAIDDDAFTEIIEIELTNDEKAFLRVLSENYSTIKRFTVGTIQACHHYRTIYSLVTTSLFQSLELDKEYKITDLLNK